MNAQNLSLFDPTDPVDFVSDLRARINLGLSSCSKEDLADAIEQLADELAPRVKWDSVIDSIERNVDTDPDKAESELDEIFGAKDALYALRSKVELLEQQLAVKSAFDDALAELFAGPVANDGGSHVGLLDYCGVCTVGHGDVGDPCERHGKKIASWLGWIVVDQTRTIIGAFQSNAPWDPRTFKWGNDAFHNAQSLAKILSAIGPVYVVEARGESEFKVGSIV